MKLLPPLARLCHGSDAAAADGNGAAGNGDGEGEGGQQRRQPRLAVNGTTVQVGSEKVLGCSKEFGQRLLSNIGLLLRKLRVVVCIHSRRLTICKHSCVRHISWLFRSAISGKQTMFTNHKASAIEEDNNSQLTQ